MENIKPFRHIVLIKFHEGVDDEARDRTIHLLKGLGDLEGILEWEIAESLDQRKGHVIVENGLFEDAEAFEKFRQSERHIEVGNFIKEIADWLIGDYIEK
jgi:quinol monooxygenase YgiN